MKLQYKKIAVKIGSNVLTKGDGTLDVARMAQLVDQIATLRKLGVEVILISSGAVAAGRTELNIDKKMDAVSSRQLWSAVGQVKLINRYSYFFREYGLSCAQVLTTKENFKDRRHYLNMKNCITTLLENGVIPIVNENDTISVTELMFTDNDELSGLIASMMKTEALVILSNINGIYTGHPDDEGTRVIPKIHAETSDLSEYISTNKSEFGRGGMITKCNIARKIAEEGIDVHIANGKRDNILPDLLDKKVEVEHSHFVAAEKQSSNVKKWLAHSYSFAKGVISINEGAEAALQSQKASSLLMVGVTEVEGYFEKGDIVKIYNSKGVQLGIGKTKYDSTKAQKYLGKEKGKVLVHYDYLYLF
ncbi:glutamate 5-kinase [Puteibacter caeruleilacunae]|nr:glutamate 5-kinase [Puteibacter caeruleilacunae]